MRLIHIALTALMLLTAPWIAPTPARADGERAGDFDYLVLALSWSPNWCALEGKARGSEQCDEAFGWVVHGLWPQYEDGWPAYCPTNARQPSRQMTAAQADVFGAGGAAWYQWKKHGVCTGLTAEQYYGLVRLALTKVNRPDVLRKLTKPIDLPASVIEDAFLEANPDWDADMVTITCTDGYIQEARICLDRELKPRDCAPDTRRDCSLTKARLEPVQ